MKLNRISQEDGQSTRQQLLGEAWWTTDFLGLMKSNSYNQVQIAKGRKIAERGQIMVKALDIGSVDAVVFEAAGGIRKVTLWVADLEDGWEIVFRVFAENQVLFTRLLNGDYPEELNDLLKKAGVSIIPGTIMDLDFRCDCTSDHICGHIFATYLALGNYINDNPMILFQLRGKSREEIVSGVDSYYRMTEMQVCGEGSRVLQESCPDNTVYETRELARYYDPGTGLDTIRILSTIQAGRESDLFRHLGQSPFTLGKTNLAEIIRECYPKAAQYAARVKAPEHSDNATKQEDIQNTSEARDETGT
jgi:uncharacterized Zn finger protein